MRKPLPLLYTVFQRPLTRIRIAVRLFPVLLLVTLLLTTLFLILFHFLLTRNKTAPPRAATFLVLPL